MDRLRLRYAAGARCSCGAGLAYRVDDERGPQGSWACSAQLRGLGMGQRHDDERPFVFYEVKSEGQPSANGRTTRPADDPWTDEDEAWDRARSADAMRRHAAQLRAQADDLEAKARGR